MGFLTQWQTQQHYLGLHQDDTTLMVESEEELKSPLMKVKEESEKACLKLNIIKTKIMASGTIISLQIDEETLETVTDFFVGSKITADGAWSHEIKRCLEEKDPWKKSYNQPRQLTKNREDHFAKKRSI